MSTYLRMAVLMATTIAVGVTGVIYYQVGVAHLFPMVYDGGGPWTDAVKMLEWAVPVTLAILELGVIAWAISGGVQEERARVRRGGRR